MLNAGLHFPFKAMVGCCSEGGPLGHSPAFPLTLPVTYIHWECLPSALFTKVWWLFLLHLQGSGPVSLFPTPPFRSSFCELKKKTCGKQTSLGNYESTFVQREGCFHICETRNGQNCLQASSKAAG